MLDYLSLDKAQLRQKQRLLQKSYDDFKAKGLKLDMSRGKPGADQTDLSGGMFDILNKDSDFAAKAGWTAVITVCWRVFRKCARCSLKCWEYRRKMCLWEATPASI